VSRPKWPLRAGLGSTTRTTLGCASLLLGSYPAGPLLSVWDLGQSGRVVGESDGQSRWLYFQRRRGGDGTGFDAFLGKKPYTPTRAAGIQSIT